MSFPGGPGNAASARGMKPVTKSDSTVLNCRGLLIGTGGTLNVTDFDGNVSTSVPVTAGMILPVAIRYVNTGGTAADIWALF
jgi:hypothetical protein